MSIKQPYISSVNLSGYKSINDVSIDFVDGLNILIGKNAAGKSNFISFLNKFLNLDLDHLFQFNGNVKVKNSKSINEIDIKRSFRVIKSNDKIEKKLSIEVNNKKISSVELLNKKYILPLITFTKNEGIQTYPFLNELVSFKTSKSDAFDTNLLDDFPYEGQPNFIVKFLLDLFHNLFKSYLWGNGIESDVNINIETIKSVINKVSEENEIVVKYLRNYTPINNFRLSPNFNVSENEQEVYVSNLIFEFKINGIWYNYNDLSDGTKRLFHIISDLISLKSNEGRERIALIEEPELGIHPHQYFKLLQFLKQESKNFQIIITTHSPQSLNILDNDELNRIVLVENKENKTVLRHLTNEEKEKAIAYKKDNMYLSDYWLYSDLEN